MLDAAWARRQEAQLFPNPPASKNRPVEKRGAWQKIAIFIVLLSLLAGSPALARILIQYGTKLVLSTWNPSLADMLGVWSVGIAGFLALALIDRSTLGVGFGLPPRKYVIIGCAVPVANCAAIYPPALLLAPWTFAGTTALSVGIVSGLVQLRRSLFVAAGEELGWRGVLVPAGRPAFANPGITKSVGDSPPLPNRTITPMPLQSPKRGSAISYAEFPACLARVSR